MFDMDSRNNIELDGLPICPACGTPILPTETVARPEHRIVHARCSGDGAETIPGDDCGPAR
jgi:hypothetical protein